MLSYSFYAYDNDGISKNLRAGARLLQRYEMEVGVAKKYVGRLPAKYLT
jgi:hypothetical protein